MMSKSFRGLVLAAALAASLGPSRPDSSVRGPSWWEVRLTVTVEGEYAVKGDGSAFSGGIRFRARWEGTMERDGDDFLLYHTRTDILDWRAREKAVLPNAVRLLDEEETPEKPSLRLNYILREGREVLFDVRVEAIRVPLNASPDKYVLLLPCTGEKGDQGGAPRYDESITKGSSRITLLVADLERGPVERKFSWEWRRQRWVTREKAPASLENRHTAEVIVTLIPH